MGYTCYKKENVRKNKRQIDSHSYKIDPALYKNGSQQARTCYQRTCLQLRVPCVKMLRRKQLSIASRHGLAKYDYDSTRIRDLFLKITKKKKEKIKKESKIYNWIRFIRSSSSFHYLTFLHRFFFFCPFSHIFTFHLFYSRSYNIFEVISRKEQWFFERTWPIALLCR